MAAPSEQGRGTVLVVSPVVPWPALAGKHIDVAGHVEFFREQGCRVVLAVHREIADDETNPFGDQTLPVEAHTIPRRGRYGPPDPESVARLQTLVDTVEPSVIWVAHADSAPLVSAVDLGDAELWWRPQNFELGQYFEKARPGFRWRASARWRALATWLPSRTGRRIHAAERSMFRAAHRIFFISERDRVVMSRLYGEREGLAWLPPRLDRRRVPVKRDKTPLDVVYVANNYTSPTQLEGARALLHEIVPRVVRSRPGTFRFHLVGRGSESLAVESLEGAVVAHGFVEHLEQLMSQMDASCLPVDIGWGLKIKMGEALAAGLPVLGAPLIFQSLPEKEGAYVVCRDSGDYVRALEDLLDADIRQNLADQAADAWSTWMREAEGRVTAELRRVAGANWGERVA